MILLSFPTLRSLMDIKIGTKVLKSYLLKTDGFTRRSTTLHNNIVSLHRPAARSAASASVRERKVGTTQGAILPNGKGDPRLRGGLTASAAENNRPDLIGTRVKMWGKSPRLTMVTWCAGKPYGLQGQICSDQGKRFHRKAFTLIMRPA